MMMTRPRRATMPTKPPQPTTPSRPNRPAADGLSQRELVALSLLLCNK